MVVADFLSPVCQSKSGVGCRTDGRLPSLRWAVGICGVRGAMAWHQLQTRGCGGSIAGTKTAVGDELNEAMTIKVM